MSKIVKNTFIYTFGNFFPKTVGFLLLPIYTIYLTPSDYGIINSMQVLQTILFVFFTLAIPRSLPRLYWDFKDEKLRRDFIGTLVISLFVVSISTLFLFIIFKNILNLTFKSIPFYPYYWITLIIVYITIFSHIPQFYLQIKEEAGKYIALTISEFLLIVGFTVYFIVFLKEGAIGVLKGQLLGRMVILPLFLYITYKMINFKFNFSYLKKALAFSFPLIPILLSSWIINLSDRIFIEKYFALADVGIYSLGYKIGEIIILFSSAFFFAYGPVFFKYANSSDQATAKRQLYRLNYSFMVVLLIATLSLSLFSKEVIRFVMDKRYWESYKIVPVIAFACLISQCSGLFNLSIYQEKKTKQLMYMVISAAVLNIILNFIFIPIWGVYGAAYATILTFTIFYIIKYLYVKKCYFIPVNWKPVLILLFSAILIIVYASLFRFSNIWVSLVVKLILMNIFIGLVFVTNKSRILFFLKELKIFKKYC